MNKISWPHIIAILALILVSLLRYTERISEANFINMLLLILGYVFGGITVYAYMKLHRNQ